ncbi:DNA-dependent ATPase mgs1 [Knufia obscura]|uniref:DNA-dependent ATPase mgs1 n=2 Tax=Knufia TaxID=430999 RepID=A0AAN8ET96_9EURO|nr:DNA-dependent ATPase mgs1 [Knufia obscura]KAK5958272.1 DNA-dependent ATPase mgs1 [Knufia fluminis]
MVSCPICGKRVRDNLINQHIDSDCSSGIESDPPPSTAPIFRTPAPKREPFFASSQPFSTAPETPTNSKKRPSEAEERDGVAIKQNGIQADTHPPQPKKIKTNAFEKAAPLAERMRPKSLDEVCGQDLVGPNGVLRGLIEADRVPSMILWGHAGTGKTTIARLVANQVNARFVEINSTSSGVAECKKIFAEAKAELGLTGRKTIIFCDEIHRFSKSQQDVFLGPVEAGHVTLIGATTENPSFKVQNALLSRCRTFTLSKLIDADVTTILERALEQSKETYNPDTTLVNTELLNYLASFSDGDARTALNLLELAMELSTRPNMDLNNLKSSLTKTLVYDRAGDQHYDTISAFHKSVRGSNPDAALYYLARMIQSGEDALYIARRMVVMASEDIGLADNTMLSLATATYSACEKIGLPECRINLAHCAVALCQAPKSTRAYRGLGNAMSALREPGIAGLPIPIHLRNAPTRMMKEMGYGKEYKYNPNYVDGKVKQDYLPEKLIGRTFLEDRDLGTEIDPDLGEEVVQNEDDEEEEAKTVVKGEPVADASVPDPVDEKHFQMQQSTKHIAVDDRSRADGDTESPEPKLPAEEEVGDKDDTEDEEDQALPLSSQTEPPAEWQ